VREKTMRRRLTGAARPLRAFEFSLSFLLNVLDLHFVSGRIASPWPNLVQTDCGFFVLPLKSPDISVCV